MNFKNLTIGVIGMGYVGLPLAVEFSKKLKVIGFDINIKRINQLKKNIDNTKEVSRKCNLQSNNPLEEMRHILLQELLSIIRPLEKPLMFKKNQSMVLFLVGVNGSGKTTTCAKLANHIKRKKSIFDFNESKRLKILEKAWLNGGLSFRACFSDITKKLNANKIASNYIKQKIINIVQDKEIAKKLTDFGHPFTSKRPTLNTDYFETFNRKNVRLIDLKENPIVKITKNGIKTNNEELKFDKIIFATGYDALSGPILSLNLTGRKNIKLNKYWKNGPTTYLGLMIPNFPNFFIISGPGSPSVLTNVPAQIQQHVEWISEFIKYLEKSNSLSVEPEAKEAENWVKKINTLANKSLFMKAKNSWYKGDNIPGKPKTFIPYPAGLPQYREICNKVRKKMYKGFNITLK